MVNGSKKTAVVEVKLTNDSLSDDCHLFLLAPKVLLAHSRPMITITSVQPIPFHPRQGCCLNMCSYIDWRWLFSRDCKSKAPLIFGIYWLRASAFNPCGSLSSTDWLSWKISVFVNATNITTNIETALAALFSHLSTYSCEDNLFIFFSLIIFPVLSCCHKGWTFLATA